MGVRSWEGDPTRQGDTLTRLSRRELLAGATAAAGVAATWSPGFRLDAAAAGVCEPPGFPAGIELYKQAFENWSGEVVVDDLWTCAPAGVGDLVRLAEWARGAGWHLRPRGRAHGWAPLAITTRGGCAERAVMLDLTRHFRAIEVVGTRSVRVGAGVTLDVLLEHLEGHGLGITGVPATGDITVAGALAVGAHGASVPAVGEERAAGHAYGSLSNLVLSLEAVVWDARRRRYVRREFDRSHPDCAAFLTHLGRALVTAVTLRVGANYRLRCESIVDIPGEELFAPPGSPGPRRFSDFLDASGRVESIWFPFTESPWLKVWTLAPERPAASREVSSPYNYPFSDSVPPEMAELARSTVTGHGEVTPLFGRSMYEVARAGLSATQSQDIWGWSRNTLFYIRASTLRVSELGVAVLTSRGNVQAVLSEWAGFWRRRLDELAAQGSWPMSMPLEMRVSGVDRPAHVRGRGARPPALAATRPRPDRRDWDVVVWINPLTFPRTPGSWELYAEFERWSARRFNGGDALHRPEWSKGWAYSGAGPWTSGAALRGWIPRRWRSGYGDRGWESAVRTLAGYDPHGVFTNSFQRGLLGAR